MDFAIMADVVADCAGRLGCGLDDGVTGKWPGSWIDAVVESAMDDAQVWHIAA